MKSKLINLLTQFQLTFCLFLFLFDLAGVLLFLMLFWGISEVFSFYRSFSLYRTWFRNYYKKWLWELRKKLILQEQLQLAADKWAMHFSVRKYGVIFIIHYSWLMLECYSSKCFLIRWFEFYSWIQHLFTYYCPKIARRFAFVQLSRRERSLEKHTGRIFTSIYIVSIHSNLDLGIEVGIWFRRLDIGPWSWDLSLEVGIWAVKGVNGRRRRRRRKRRNFPICDSIGHRLLCGHCPKRGTKRPTNQWTNIAGCTVA